MNILMISHEYPPIGGGGANACMYLAGEYIKKGHSVTVLTVYYEGLLEYEENEGLRIVRLKSSRKHKEHCGFVEMLDFMFRAIKKADKLVKAGIAGGKHNDGHPGNRFHEDDGDRPQSKGEGDRPLLNPCVERPFDICQVFFAIPAGPVGYYLKKRYGLKYVIRFGGGDIPGFQDRFKFIYNVLEPFEKIIWKEAAALVANSEGLKKLAQAFYDKKEILVIPNGVDPEAFTPGSDPVSNFGEKAVMLETVMGTDPSQSRRGTELSQEPFRILFVSRLIERKGLQFIIPFLKELDSEAQGGIKLTIVGDGPYRGQLGELADIHGVRDYLEFTGQKDKQELSKYYNNADVFILPSKKEGMPNVVLEAMSAGLPVIMTPCQGSKELIDGNGFIANTVEFKEKLLTLANDREAAKRLGQRSRELIFEKFLWEKTAGRYLTVFDSIIKS